MSFSIAGKTAIVTGAANGVGRAIARHFASKGANVVFADMDEDGLAKEVGEDADKDESNVRCFAGDLREKLTIANLLSATIDAFDRVDILVKQAEEDGKEDEPAGTIINLSSIAARRAHPELLGYSVSCAALDQMTRSMAVALAPNRIRVNAVAFGSVMSASLQDTLRDDDESREDILAHTPLKRIASPREVADAVQFLASDSSGFMTGQIVTVDGGRTLLDSVTAPAH